MIDYSLTTAQKQVVTDRTVFYLENANRALGLNLGLIPILFDLKGKASGMFVVGRDKKIIRYNEIIFSKYFEDAVISTTAHEVAHYVNYELHGAKRVKPHGQEWRSLMQLFDVKPEVTSRYDLAGLPLRQQKQHLYQCDCMQHSLSTTRHNRIQASKVSYNCRRCLKPLKLKPPIHISRSGCD